VASRPGNPAGVFIRNSCAPDQGDEAVNRSTVLFTALLAGAMIVAGCGGDSGSGTTTTTAGTATTTTGAETTTTGAETTTSGATGTAAATVAVADNTTIGQPILVDGNGMTVYMFDPDGTETTSQVPANIKANWPPVTATGTPTAGAGLDASKLTTSTQADGTDQVLYNGHLLYTFVGDSAAGAASGQGLGGVWFVLSASGDKVSS
jgi:predicted lipoprotein with Yx(FWY)xxD motif